jgi:hypothetical protein
MLSPGTVSIFRNQAAEAGPAAISTEAKKLVNNADLLVMATSLCSRSPI